MQRRPTAERRGGPGAMRTDERRARSGHVYDITPLEIIGREAIPVVAGG